MIVFSLYPRNWGLNITLALSFSQNSNTPGALVDWPLCDEFQTHFTEGLGNKAVRNCAPLPAYDETVAHLELFLFQRRFFSARI